MKKILAGAMGAMLMSAGLVASAGTAAHADPYPGAVATTTTASAPLKVKRKKSAQVCGSVVARTGTANPVGTLRITVTKNRNNKVVGESLTTNYVGGVVCLTTIALKKTGGYTVRASFVSKAGTVFTDSSGSNGFDVIKKKRRN